MARLNEPPLPTESIEVVKRRFIRQNRELAKHNSAQSIRIRNLEIQTSQLLAENVALREQIAELQGQVEGRTSRHGVAPELVSSFKARLEEKMQDLVSLVSELEVPPRPAAPTTRRKTANVTSLQEWHDAAAAALAEMGPQYRLETIREDKHFPRRTLGAEEIRDIVNASESPDIGPPPVAHFDELDPVKFDPPARKDIDAQQEQEIDALAAPLSINLETRRKRKDGQPRLDIRRLSVFQSPPDNAEPADEEAPQTQVLPIRAGAKRKLSARDGEEKPAAAIAATATARDPFQFSRRTASARATEEPRGTERKALGAKNANVDVVNSPKKAAHDKPEKKGDAVDALKTVRSAVSLDERRSRERKPKRGEPPVVEEVIRAAQPPPPTTADLILEPATDPPKKLATPDLFSPASIEGSAGAPQDTPEPNASHSEIPGASRPGRRARSQLNYAEPSLNTKMRRPGKELVDAVTKQGKPVAVRAQPRFKKDPDESATSGDEWKKLPSLSSSSKDKDVEAIGEPNSPLRDKALSLSQALRDQKERDKAGAARDAEQHATKDTIVDDVPNGASGPAALTSMMRKRLGRPAQVLPASIADANIEGMSDEKKESLAIFDFNDSPPARDGGAAPPDKTARARNPRRHSSVPALPLAQELRAGAGDGGAKSWVNKDVVAKGGGSGGSIAVGAGVGGAGDSLSAARRERAAARRRSMML